MAVGWKSHKKVRKKPTSSCTFSYSSITYNCTRTQTATANCNINNNWNCKNALPAAAACCVCEWVWNCVDFHFQHTRRWHAHCALLWFFALIALQFQVFQFSFVFRLCFFFSFVSRLLFFLPAVWRAATKRVRWVCCSRCCCCHRALELIFIYISGRWFSIIRAKLALALAWFGLVWFAWLKCYLPDWLTDGRTTRRDGGTDGQLPQSRPD